MSKFLVIEILSEVHIRKIDFQLGALHVNPSRFAGVQQAVVNGRIRVPEPEEIEPYIMATYFAVYDFRLNEILIDPRKVSSSTYGRSAVVHECVHAIHDLYRAEATTRLSGEAAAYIAQCLYLRLTSSGQPRAEPGNAVHDPQLDLVFDMADDLVVQFDLERRRGVAIPHSAYQPLRRALSNVYLDYSDTEREPHIGVPSMRARSSGPPPSSRAWQGGCAIGW